jgi:dTDP-glucose pyrophosphorylase
MVRIGISEVYIVIGHLGFEITKALGDGESFGVRLHYIEQKETLGIAHALGKLEPYINTPFMLFLGDIYFVTINLEDMVRIFKDENFQAVLAIKEEREEEAIKRNFAVLLNENGSVKRVIEKPRYISNRMKGCGIYLFDLNIFDAIRRTPRTAMRDEYEITDSIQILINDEHRVGIAKVIEDDINITFPRDLLLCSLDQLEKTGKRVLIGANTEIHPDAVIERSVIGDGVKISSPVNISNAVIFSNTEVKQDIRNGIITPDIFIDCSYKG